jgi:hypothetical protein
MYVKMHVQRRAPWSDTGGPVRGSSEAADFSSEWNGFREPANIAAGL